MTIYIYISHFLTQKIRTQTLSVYVLITYYYIYIYIIWISCRYLVVSEISTSSAGGEEARRGTAPVSQLEDLMRRRGVDAAWDALEASGWNRGGWWGVGWWWWGWLGGWGWSFFLNLLGIWCWTFWPIFYIFWGFLGWFRGFIVFLLREFLGFIYIYIYMYI